MYPMTRVRNVLFDLYHLEEVCVKDNCSHADLASMYSPNPVLNVQCEILRLFQLDEECTVRLLYSCVEIEVP